MKNKLKFLIFLVPGMVSLSLPAQEDCRVLKPEVSGEYSGKCKDGLAHGKGKAVGRDTYIGQFSKGLPEGNGTYTWANGDYYTGEWKNGLRQGEGTMNFFIEGRDTALAGLWENDLYLGPVPKSPEVWKSISIDRYTITKTGGSLSRVLINFYQNGARNLGIENLLLSTTSGTDTRLGQAIGYENITFPVTVKVSYSTWNKSRTVMVNAIFEFEIYEPGDWEVDLHN